MINRKTTVNLHDGVNLHMVHSDKFKTVLFGLYIRRPLNESEVAYNALLSRVIDKATSKLPTERALNQALEMLYGSLIVSDVHKYGEKQMLQIKLQVPGETFIGDSTLYKGVIEILNDMFNNPRLIDGGFDPEIVRREKEGLISEVELRRDNKEGWVVSTCIETMCKDEIYRIHEFGTIEAIKEITPVALYEHMKHIWKNSEIDICIIGNFDEAMMMDTINTALTFERGSIVKLSRENIFVIPQSVTYVEEPYLCVMRLIPRR